MQRIKWLVCFAALLCSAPFTMAQMPAGAHLTAPQVFGGYSLYHPGGTINGAAPKNFNGGVSGQFEVMTNRWAGLVFDSAYYRGNNASAFDFSFGLRLQYSKGRFTPFGQAMLGMQRFSPEHLPNRTGATFLGGGGLDVRVSPRFSLRPAQVLFTNATYNLNESSGKNNFLNGVRFQTGIVYRLTRPDTAVAAVPSARCDLEAEQVTSGEALHGGVDVHGFRDVWHLEYSYESSGGKVVSEGSSVTIDTKGVEPGEYTLTATVKGRKGKAQMASCQRKFTVLAASAPAETKPAEEAPAKPAEEAAPVQETVPSVPAAPAPAAPAVETPAAVAPAPSEEKPAAPAVEQTAKPGEAKQGTAEKGAGTHPKPALRRKVKRHPQWHEK